MDESQNHSMTVATALAKTVAAHGSNRAFVEGDTVVTWRDVDRISTVLAHNLKAHGLGHGDRIAVILPNRLEWIHLFFAAAKIGAAVVGLNVRYRDTELDYMLNDSRAKAIIAPFQTADFDYAGYFQQNRARFPSLQHRWFVDAPDANADQDFALLLGLRADLDPGEAFSSPATADDLLVIIYTSGTTGRPKGAGLTHRSALASARAQHDHTRMTSDDFVHMVLPMNHVGGISCSTLTCMLAGAACEMVPVFKADVLLRMMQRNPPTVFMGVPTMQTLILMDPEFKNTDFSRLRLNIVGGSIAEPALVKRLQQAYPGATVMNLYGMSEVSGANIMTPWDASDDVLARSIGRPLPGMEVRVLTPDGQDVSAGEIGELTYRGASVIPAYVGAQDGTSAFIAGGWLRSGDLGYIDEAGFICLKGRSKDMYIQGGYNVYPAEIEAVIGAMEGVVMVAGIGVPDSVLGEVGRYYVVQKPDGKLTEQTIQARCREHLADYKIPRQVVFRNELPLTPMGKIEKAALRAQSKAE